GDVALAMRRVACLGALGGPRAAHVAVDASGGILTRRGAIDLTPRSRRLDCPVWPVHRAPPGRPLASPVRDPEDVRALAVAWARRDGMSADMLIFDPAAAAASVYAALAAGKPADVGPDCRICAHQACRWRREPSVLEA
ncbi:MAG: short-chain fatty acyl-CoA regulator family protein, partial [Pseudomonadota bacterium]